MLRNRVKDVLLRAVLGLAFALGAAGPAHAIIYTGNWDPNYGGIFPELGWKGSATFFVPDACLAGAGWIQNVNSCSGGGMQVLGAEVSFYDIANPAAVVERLTFNPNVQVYEMNVSNGVLAGVSTDFLGPVHAMSSIAGSGAYYFDLQFLRATEQNVELYYTPGAINPRCALDGNPPGCGSAAIRPTMILTAIPEPGSYAMLLAGLGAIGLMLRYRRRG